MGGGETHARLLGEALIGRGVPVFVLTQRRPRGASRREDVGRIPVVRTASGGSDRWGKYLMLLPVLVKLITLRRRYDLVYVCGLRTLGIPALLTGWVLGRPVVLRAESRTEMSGGYALEGASPFLRRLIRSVLDLRNRLYRRAAAFVSISDDLTAEFEACGMSPSRIARILNGVDTRTFAPPAPGEPSELRRRLRLPADATIVIYTGKLNAGKGLEMLLRAWKRLDAEDLGPNHLVLVGGGANQYLSRERELRTFVADEGLAGRVSFTGYVDNVADYLRAADVFTLPSESEALPLSLLEALACGLPAVVTRTGGMPEVVTDGENGFVIPVNDEDALVRVLERLAADPARRRDMARAGRRTVQERFGIEAVAEAHERLFRRVLGNREAPS